MRVTFPLTLAIAMAIGSAASDARAENWLSLNQPQFITASFEDPAPEVEPVAPACSTDLGACSTCNSSDCRCGCWTPGASVEATFLWSSLDSTIAATGLADVGNGVALVNSAGDVASDDMFVAPRIWVGAKRNCWGIGGRFWTMEQSSIAGDPILDVPVGDRFSVERSLEAYTVDLEVTRDLTVLRSKSMLSFGARYGHMQNQAVADSAAMWSAAPAAFTSATAISSREFDGTGISLGLQGTRQIRCSNWHLFWNARGSILWGDSSVAALTSVAILDAAAGAATQDTFALAGNNGDMFIGELQLGLQYERQLKCAPCTAFVRVAGEYQYWDTNGNLSAASASLADTASVPGTTYQALAVASAGDSVLDLFGFSVGTGLKW